MLLGIYLEKNHTIIPKDTCTPMFPAALFTTARIWQQPKRPSTGRKLKKAVNMTMKYYSAIKRNKTVPFAEMWMDLESVKWNKLRKRRTNIIS